LKTLSNNHPLVAQRSIAGSLGVCMDGGEPPDSVVWGPFRTK
jgi:hypothetical protein